MNAARDGLGFGQLSPTELPSMVSTAVRIERALATSENNRDSGTYEYGRGLMDTRTAVDTYFRVDRDNQHLES